MNDDQQQEFRSIILKLQEEADYLGMRNAEIAAMLGMPRTAWPLPIDRQWEWQPEPWQEARVRQLAEVFLRLVAWLGPRGAVWLREVSPALAVTPVTFLMSGGPAVRALRDVLRLEGRAP